VLEIVDDHLLVTHPETLVHIMQYLSLPGNLSPEDLLKVEALRGFVVRKAGEADAAAGDVDMGSEMEIVEGAKSVVLKSK
jgi:hypothetical protein